MKREKILDDIAVDHKYEWQGQLRTLANWSKVLGINLKTLYGRLEEGWTIERAFTEKPRKNVAELITLPTGEQVSQTQLARQLNMPRATLSSQIDRGWCIEKILDHHIQKTSEPKPGSERLLKVHYRKLVKLVGALPRDGSAPSQFWFTKVDEILDRIWQLDDVLSDNSSATEAWLEQDHAPEPVPAPPARPKEKALTLEEADAIRRKQNGQPVVINPHWNPEKIHLSPDVDNRS